MVQIRERSAPQETDIALSSQGPVRHAPSPWERAGRHGQPCGPEEERQAILLEKGVTRFPCYMIISIFIVAIIIVILCPSVLRDASYLHLSPWSRGEDSQPKEAGNYTWERQLVDSEDPMSWDPEEVLLILTGVLGKASWRRWFPELIPTGGSLGRRPCLFACV